MWRLQVVGQPYIAATFVLAKIMSFILSDLYQTRTVRKAVYPVHLELPKKCRKTRQVSHCLRCTAYHAPRDADTSND